VFEDGINHSNDSQLQRFIFEGDRHEHSNCVQRVWRSMSGLGSSVYLGIMGLAGGGPAHVGASMPAKVSFFSIFPMFVPSLPW
jgi:hypothetical protein